jgi:hypothetical protein
MNLFTVFYRCSKYVRLGVCGLLIQYRHTKVCGLVVLHKSNFLSAQLNTGYVNHAFRTDGAPLHIRTCYLRISIKIFTVGAVTWLQAGGSGVWIQVRGNSSTFIKSSTKPLGHTQPPIQRESDIFPSERKLTHFSPCSEEVKNECSYTSNPFIYFCGMEKFTFLTYKRFVLFKWLNTMLR